MTIGDLVEVKEGALYRWCSPYSDSDLAIDITGNFFWNKIGKVVRVFEQSAEVEVLVETIYATYDEDSLKLVYIM